MIQVEDYILKSVENTLRLCANHFNSYERKTCLDRDIVTNLNQVRKLLNGQEITGRERIENLIALRE